MIVHVTAGVKKQVFALVKTVVALVNVANRKTKKRNKVKKPATRAGFLISR